MTLALVAPFAEAVRATTQPCTFLLIVPVVAAVVAARAAWQALVGAVAAVVVGGWMLADNRWILEGAWLQASAVLVIGLLAALLAPMVLERRSIEPRTAGTALSSPWGSAAVVAAIALLATQWWRPCVGEEFGVILNWAQHDIAGALIPMAAYMLGAMVPVAGLVAVRYASDPPERAVSAIGVAFGAIGIVVAVFLVVGRHESVTATLTRWTLG